MLNLTKNFTSFSTQKIPKCLGIISFYSGNWREKENKKIVNHVYLIKTISSLTQYVDKIILYVCEDGLDFLLNLFENLEIKKIFVPKELESDKLVYPVGKYGLLDRAWENYDFVFFTESDQIIYSNNLYQIASKLSNNQYLSPHRLEKKYKNYNQKFNQQIIIYDNLDYVLYNHFPNQFIDLNDFWEAKTFISSYGASWIARTSFIDNLDFNKKSNCSLHIPCKVLFESGHALKTKNIFDFFVDHLSGFDNALSQAGYSINSYPGKW